MKRKSVIISLLTLLLIFPLVAQAAPVGKFTSVEGNVDVTPPGREAIPANVEDPVNVGDIIRTKSKSKCEVTFIDGSILRLAENSRLRVSEFTQEKEQRSATLNLFRGKIQNIVKTVTGAAAAQSKYEIQMPTAVAGIRGTNFFAYYQAGVSGAIFKEGTGYGYSLNRPEEVRTINPGQAMLVTDPDLPPVIRPATALELNQHEKDTAPSEKPKEEGKKEEEKKPDEAVAKADEGKKEEAKEGEAEAPKVVEAAAAAALREMAGPVEIIAREEVTAVTPQPPPPTPYVPPTTMIPTNFTGNLYGQFYNDSFGASESLTASLSGSIPYGATSGTVSVSSGIYSNPPNLKMWAGSFEGTTDSGGAFLGYTGGSWTSWDGNLAGFYVEGSQIGFLTGSLSGTYDASTFSGSGSLTQRFVGTHSIVPATGQTLLEALSSSTITGVSDYWSMGMETMSIVNYDANTVQNWGIYKAYDYGDFSNPSDASTWIAKIGGGGSFGAYAYTSGEYSILYDDYGYWLADIEGTAVNNKPTGTLEGRFLTYTKFGTIEGDLLGTYNTTDNTWQALSIGTWSGEPLSHVSDVSASLYATARHYEGRYNYAAEGYYSYNYYTDNHSGYVAGYIDYRRPDLGTGYTTYYYADGTKATDNYKYICDGECYWSYTDTVPGTWNPETDALASLLGIAPEGGTLDYSYDHPYGYSASSLNALMGGRGSLWTATQTSPADVTVMGHYDTYYAGNRPHIWDTEISSYNYKDDTYTTYDGGAYKGFLAGTEINNDIDGRLIALYIDPSGNAGYLKGSLTEGTVYPATGMFEMDGSVYPTRVASNIGIAAGDLNNSVYTTGWMSEYWYSYLYNNDEYNDEQFAGAFDTWYPGNRFAGAFDTGGEITRGDVDYWYDWDHYHHMRTMSLANYEANKTEPWGIYSLNTGGTYSAPETWTTWEAKTGGNAPFGAYNIANYHYGAYTYPDGGSYSYSYYTDNRSGTISYRNPTTKEGQETYYQADGTTATTNYAYGDPYGYGYSDWYSTGDTAGTWDKAKTLASLVATPYDPANATLNYKSKYGVGDDDHGYWLADVKNGSWADGRLTGTVGGRFLTYTKLGTMEGDLLGTYNTTDNTWQAVSLGTWEGTELSHVSDVSSGLIAQARHYTGSYSYADGSYSYDYYTDNHYGYVSYRRADSTLTSYDIHYNSDGTSTKTTYSYDATSGYTATGTKTGTWATADGLSFIATAEDAANATLASSDNYRYQYNDGNFNALLGGTDTIWTATQTTPAKVTMMGNYYSSSAAPHMWGGGYYYYYGYNSGGSYNYKDGSYTTYDGGAYRGYLAGTEIDKLMDAQGIALYIDPSGNAGYLKGALTGKAYPDISMFVMDGSIYPTEVASNVGIAPGDLNDSIAENYYYYYYDTSLLSGAFDTGGKIKSDYDYYYYYQGLSSMSLVNYEANKAEPWGIYSLGMGGSYEVPATPWTSWTAKAGGQGYFGAYNVANNHYGSYSYGDGGSYSYNYYTDNRAGDVSYRRADSTLTSYDIHYNSDGTYAKTTYSYDATSGYTATGTETGTWTTANGLSFMATAADATNATLSYGSKYGVRNDDWGYWLADITGGKAEANKLTGAVSGRFITRTQMGDASTGTGMAGDLLGTYNTTDNTWQAVSLGTWEGTPLAYSGGLTWGRFGHIDASGQASWDSSSDISGIVGSTDSLWSSPQSVAIGRYSNPNSKPIWDMDIRGNTDLENTNAADRGAFYMSGGGISLSNAIEGRAVGLYIKPDGQGGYLAGYLTSNLFTIATYPGISMWEASPAITAMPGVPTTVTPSELYLGSDKLKVSWLHNLPISGAIAGFSNTELLSLIDQNWGRWMSWSSGSYTDLPSEDWSASIEFIDSTRIIGQEVTGSKWSDNKVIGTTRGYGADISSTPETWISVGETLGTFNPSDYTFQAVSMGLWIETGKFLTMAATSGPTGRDALAALNIPCVQVGQADLAGSRGAIGDSLSVSMTGVKFFSYSTGEAPKIWATNQIGGSYDVSGVSVPSPLILNGSSYENASGLSATFTPKVWDTTSNKWMATVNSGSGTVNNSSIQFSGAAAGTLSGGSVGNITSGTGAGIAKPAP